MASNEVERFVRSLAVRTTVVVPRMQFVNGIVLSRSAVVATW